MDKTQYWEDFGAEHLRSHGWGSNHMGKKSRCSYNRKSHGGWAPFWHNATILSIINSIKILFIQFFWQWTTDTMQLDRSISIPAINLTIRIVRARNNTTPVENEEIPYNSSIPGDSFRKLVKIIIISYAPLCAISQSLRLQYYSTMSYRSSSKFSNLIAFL